MELVINLSVICLAIIALMPFSARPLPEPDPLTGKTWSYAGFFMFAYSFAIIFVAAFRNGFVDTAVYKGMYTSIGTDVDNAFNGTVPIEDYGFSLLMVFLNHIDPDPQFLVFVTAVFTFSVYLYTINKYSFDLPFAMLLFLFTGFFTPMNGIRQVLASAFMLLALPLLIKKKTIKYLLVIWLCTTLHASAYIMMPLYFVLSGKRLNKGIWVMLGLTVFCLLFPELATRVMGELLEDSTYKDYLEVESQMSLMRFLVELVPIIITMMNCLINRGDGIGLEQSDPCYQNQRLIDVLINMQFVSFCFTTLGLRMVFFARISLYFPCVLPLLLPVTLKGSFNRESGKISKMIAMGMYLLFFAYQTYTYDMHGYFWDFYLNL